MTHSNSSMSSIHSDSSQYVSSRQTAYDFIPKVIHYCWFGGAPKSELICKCIKSWRRFCPDYEIIEWNESNFDIGFCPFLQDAYDAKKWAFVSDVARLKIIHEHGGIYMDTDVEILVPDPFVQYQSYEAFFFHSPIGVNTGNGFGGKAGNPLIGALLSSYFSITFNANNLHPLKCPLLNTPVILEQFPELILNQSTQIFNGHAFIAESFYWKNARHYCAFSWRSNEQAQALQHVRKNFKISKFRQRLQKSAIFLFFDQARLFKLKKIYTFLVYDLFDYGLSYWIYKIRIKLLRLFKL